jgi:hypothetical protein
MWGSQGENTRKSRLTFTKDYQSGSHAKRLETRLVGEPEHNLRMKTCAEISKKATPEDKKEEPILEKLEEVHIKTRTTPSVDFAKSYETNKRSMSSVKPLREFEHMDWVPIDYREVFDKRRSFPNQKGMVRALEADFPTQRRRKTPSEASP